MFLQPRRVCASVAQVGPQVVKKSIKVEGGLSMIFSRMDAAVIATTVFLSGCTQQQQSAISSSEWERNINQSLEDLGKAAQSKIEHTSNWVSTEAELGNLKASIKSATEKGEVTDSQAANLRNSLRYIEGLQESSIRSGEGISASEKDRITAAVERVEKRLTGWLAGSQKVM